MRYQSVLQHSEEDCGAACIANHHVNGHQLGFSGVDAVTGQKQREKSDDEIKDIASVSRWVNWSISERQNTLVYNTNIPLT
ncbi:hypothetical protein [uncultured Nostoc sp.]|uniref:hypothetical protein n=1 Tax=uncultured Nostoc sp. TaxID=340711 RepID=UPI0035CCA7B1